MRARAAGLLVASGLFGLGCSGLFATPGPFAGGAELGYLATGGDPEADAPRIRARLAAVGVEAKVEVRPPDELDILLVDVVPDFPLERFLRPGRLELVFPDETLSNDFLASVEATEDTLGMPVVNLKLTESGAARFCELSGRHVQAKIPIRVDGETLMEPVIREAICGGELQIALGAASPDPRAEAEALAASLSHAEPLSGPWEVEKVWER